MGGKSESFSLDIQYMVHERVYANQGHGILNPKEITPHAYRMAVIKKK